MEMLPKVLMASDSLSSGLLWNLRVQAKNIELFMEPNLSLVVKRSRDENPDLIMLDLTPLTKKGLDLIHDIREEQAGPVLVLISNQEADSLGQLYATGADDCIVKPIEPAILLAKINAWLRRCSVIPVEMLSPLRVGKVYLNTPEKVMSINEGLSIRLTNIETRLLYVLMSRAGHAVSKDELINLVWRNKEDVCRDILNNVIFRLRQKLEVGPAALHCILTVPGVGYKFECVRSMKGRKMGTRKPCRIDNP